MSEIQARIKSSVIEAMKAKQQARLDALRLITSSLKQKEVDERKQLTDNDVIACVQKLVKQAVESLDQAKGAGRTETVTEVELQLAVYKEFLPQAMSQDELKATIEKVVTKLKSAGTLGEGAKALGPVMKEVRELVAGRADGKAIQETVKVVLGL